MSYFWWFMPSFTFFSRTSHHISVSCQFLSLFVKKWSKSSLLCVRVLIALSGIIWPHRLFIIPYISSATLYLLSTLCFICTGLLFAVGLCWVLWWITECVSVLEFLLPFTGTSWILDFFSNILQYDTWSYRIYEVLKE